MAKMGLVLVADEDDLYTVNITLFHYTWNSEGHHFMNMTLSNFFLLQCLKLQSFC